MADDIVVITIEFCGKDASLKRMKRDCDKITETPRFPAYLRDNYVQKLLETALAIQENVYVANGSREGARRKRIQEDAASKCEYFLHLQRIAYDKGWVSEKQFVRWSSLTTKLKWRIVEWWKSTKT